MACQCGDRWCSKCIAVGLAKPSRTAAGRLLVSAPLPKLLPRGPTPLQREREREMEFMMPTPVTRTSTKPAPKSAPVPNTSTKPLPKAKPKAAPRKTAQPCEKIGSVKIFFEDKGFGFITLDDMCDVFFHVSATPGSARLLKNTPVKCTVSAAQDGKLRATAVTVITGQLCRNPACASRKAHYADECPLAMKMSGPTKSSVARAVQPASRPPCPTKSVFGPTSSLFVTGAKSVLESSMDSLGDGDAAPSVLESSLDSVGDVNDATSVKSSQFGEACVNKQSDMSDDKDEETVLEKCVPLVLDLPDKDDQESVASESTCISSAVMTRPSVCHDDSWSGWYCHHCGKTVPLAVETAGVAATHVSETVFYL